MQRANAMEIAIQEAKKIVLAKLSQEELSDAGYVIDQFIERLEAKASLPQEASVEATTDELLEEIQCGMYFDNHIWIAHKIIDFQGEIDGEGKTPREALLALKEKLFTKK